MSRFTQVLSSLPTEGYWLIMCMVGVYERVMSAYEEMMSASEQNRQWFPR
jgi:hypothetical protein